MAARWWRDGSERSRENHGTKSTMVTLKSNKEELHKFSCFYTSQFSSFVAYDRKTSPSKISPVRRVEHICLSIQCWLRVTVSSRRMESSDFTSILAR